MSSRWAARALSALGCVLIRHGRRMSSVTHWPVPAQASSKSEFLQRPRAASEPITPALCWAHSRRQFFELADIAKNARRGRSAAAISPIALEAVRRIDEIGRAHV